MNASLLIALLPLVLGQIEDESLLHFSNPKDGRAVWIVDEASLPWIGEYEYLRLNATEKTILLTVVDSSTGKTLGECSHLSGEENQWVNFRWTLKADSLMCSISPNNSSRVVFPLSTGSRTFSVRMQAVNGPACVRHMMVQNERPIGCPPHLAVNSFSSLHLNCSCPYYSTEGGSTEPPFPIFDLDGTQSFPKHQLPTWTTSPCASFVCLNSGTCVVAQEGTAACLCRDGFIGATCEVDLCSTVPCQNGGFCRADGSEVRCECPPKFGGVLCESREKPCDIVCMNGNCMVENGTEVCACKEGFIGKNCNVIDVCLGDAACALFGEQSKCVIDEANLAVTGAQLQNASYDCLCPHPVNGAYVDCLALHLSTSVSESITSATTPVDFIFETSTAIAPSPMSTVAEPQETTAMEPMDSFVPTDGFSSLSNVASHGVLTPTTTTTRTPPSLPPIFATLPSEHTTASTRMTTTPEAPTITFTTTSATWEPSTAQVTEPWQPPSTHMVLPSSVTPQSTIPFWMTVTQTPVSKTSWSTEEMTTKEMTTMTVPVEEVMATHETMPTTQGMLTTVNLTTTSTSTQTTTVSQNGDAIKMWKTGASDSSEHRSSAASWIIAIVAMIVLGFLLLATTLFILRYVKQSRKLHGKYNPAREEHALSAAFSMPMSHITKEERLI
ncbi:hypothetical protein Q1695_001642 [Nippostrongylus brasiliensis]|nr:hypothetical protein Q1695_001642 [Nippostrongylus brasiliensis]